MNVFATTVIAAALFLGAGCAQRMPSDGAYASVPAQEFRDLIEKGAADSVLVDIRTPEEFSRGYIKGALNIDFYAPDFRDRLAGLDKAKAYLIYCRSGNRTTQTMALMEELGFKRVVSLGNGILEWSANGFPLEK